MQKEKEKKFAKEEKDFLCNQADGKIAGLEEVFSRELKKLFTKKFTKSIVIL